MLHGVVRGRVDDRSHFAVLEVDPAHPVQLGRGHRPRGSGGAGLGALPRDQVLAALVDPAKRNLVLTRYVSLEVGLDAPRFVGEDAHAVLLAQLV